MLRGMSPTFEYFLASSDDEAAAVLERVAGPSSAIAPPKRGIFGKKTAPAGPAPAALRVIDGKGIEPVVVLGMLESIVTKKSFEETLDAAGDPVVAAREGQEMVLRVSGSIGPALDDLSAEQRLGVATEWAEIEEFFGMADAKDLAQFIDDFAALAADGKRQGLALYCWSSA
jgi:hypothetical protein